MFGFIRNWFTKKDNYVQNHTFDDDDRLRSAESRKHRAELKRLEFERDKLTKEMELMKAKAELQELRNDLFGFNDDTEEKDDFMTSMAKQLILNNPQILANLGGGGGGISPTKTNSLTSQSPQQNAEYLDVLKIWIEDYPQEIKKIDKKALLDLKTRLGI